MDYLSLPGGTSREDLGDTINLTKERKEGNGMRYRIDFRYWHVGSGFSHVETMDAFDLPDGIKPTISDYIDNSDIEWNQFADYCDAIRIEMVREEDDEPIDIVWWDEDGMTESDAH